jgi:hypothetical protein
MGRSVFSRIPFMGSSVFSRKRWTVAFPTCGGPPSVGRVPEAGGRSPGGQPRLGHPEAGAGKGTSCQEFPHLIFFTISNKRFVQFFSDQKWGVKK